MENRKQRRAKKNKDGKKVIVSNNKNFIKKCDDKRKIFKMKK